MAGSDDRLNAETLHSRIVGKSLLFSGTLWQAATEAPVSRRDMWPVWDAQVRPVGYDPATFNPWGVHQRFLPVRVAAKDGLTPGDIHVDAIARGSLYEPGVYTIKRKTKWPTWRPTDEMIERDPTAFERFADGQDGGPTNPLGSRAFYLFVGNRDTYLRIHGTPLPRSIGSRASSGCVRMVMAHIIGLYENVQVGSTAYLYPPENPIAPNS